MTTLMRNGRDRRSGKPVMGHAILERALLVGTRSADHIRASGHSSCISDEASLYAKNRPYTWLHPNASQIGQIPLAPRAPLNIFLSFRGSAGRLSLWERSGHEPARQIPPKSIANDPGCVKTLRGIIAPGIPSFEVIRRAKKTQKFVFRSTLRPNQISF